MFVGYSNFMISIFNTQVELNKHLNKLRAQNISIGFVPTMGALHLGHLSLMQLAFKNSDRLVVSIFVNPTQFNNTSDLEKYPRDISSDTRLIKQHFQDKNIIIYAPTVNDVYGANVKSTRYYYDGLEKTMEGANRPGHFDGVGTVLQFLFEIVKPQVAVFGEKDFQQLQIVRKLVEKLHLPIYIIGAPILREKNMLAMSSRNERLTTKARKEAAFIYDALQRAKAHFSTNSINSTVKMVQNLFSEHNNFELEYFTIASEETLVPVKRKYKKHTYRAFIVAHLEDVRLIDNMRL